jgi:uncharacterized SAM-binding protein YcdF (DUF218 family)
MEDFYQICKSFTDPVLIIFILLVVALVFCLIDNKKNSGILALGLAVILLYGASIAPVGNYLAYSLEKKYFRPPAINKPLDVIVVLAGGVIDINESKSTVASEATAARLLRGVEIFHKYGAKYFVCAGSGITKISNAEVMAQMAVALGVPKEKIRIDARSENTREHAIELNKMFTDKSIHIALVTSGFHMRRSEREFKRYFKNVLPWPASYSYTSSSARNVLKYIPQTAPLSETTNALREFIGSFWYEIRDI